MGDKKKWLLVTLDRWSSYAVRIAWESAWADSALVLLDKWSSYRGGCLSRFDCENKKANIVVGCIYKHPNMDVIEFINYLNQMLEKASKEQKQILLLGDLNINLVNYNIHQPTNHFLDSLTSNSITMYIL